jgi:hypothetical protein
LQEYCPYSEEVGVNYLRRPNEPSGQIVGITRKRFPSVVGDGKNTLTGLLLKDERARFLVGVYRDKKGQDLERVLERGERYLLTEIGNHCQGAVFERGDELKTPELEKFLDQVSKSIPGFYVGRFDIRFESDDALMRGKQLKIIEINGAAGEATHIYDRKMRLTDAYAVLFRQLEGLFELGAWNMRMGDVFVRPGTGFLGSLFDYQKLRKNHVTR